jgi:hypothetical protein
MGIPTSRYFWLAVGSDTACNHDVVRPQCSSGRSLRSIAKIPPPFPKRDSGFDGTIHRTVARRRLAAPGPQMGGRRLCHHEKWEPKQGSTECSLVPPSAFWTRLARCLKSETAAAACPCSTVAVAEVHLLDSRERYDSSRRGRLRRYKCSLEMT